MNYTYLINLFKYNNSILSIFQVLLHEHHVRESNGANNE